MSDRQTFKAVIQNAGGGGAFVKVPFDVEEVFGAKKPRIQATIDGVPYRGLLSRMGTDYHMLIILKEIREKIGKTFGDEVTVTVEQDSEPRQLEIPGDFRGELLKDRKAGAFFTSLSYTHQKEYVTWITEAKKEETRQKRVVKTIEMLKQGKKAR